MQTCIMRATSSNYDGRQLLPSSRMCWAGNMAIDSQARSNYLADTHAVHSASLIDGRSVIMACSKLLSLVVVLDDSPPRLFRRSFGDVLHGILCWLGD
eukprot:scaffold409806_cov22-Prasinocladus_malaysianus.AAC.1